MSTDDEERPRAVRPQLHLAIYGKWNLRLSALCEDGSRGNMRPVENGDLSAVLEAIRRENAAAHAETRRYVEVVADATRREFQETTEETRRHFQGVTEETRQHFQGVTEETRQHFQALTEETRRHFDIVSEATRKDVRLLAETVSHVQEELVRTRDHLELKIEESAAETRAMIKVSHGDLDRRLGYIESKS